MTKKTTKKSPSQQNACTLRFEPARMDSLFELLDALAWLDKPTVGEAAQFAGIDPRTAGKLFKNCILIGLVETKDELHYSLVPSYPHKGTPDEKKNVVREILIRMPLLQHVRQFIKLGDGLDNAVRKAATIEHVENFHPSAIAPLIEWAKQLKALNPDIAVEDLVDEAEEAKELRHKSGSNKKVVFLSHSSHDKQFIRKLATDLTAAGIKVWLDEQNIRVGDSIPDKIDQGLASSDYFLIALSEHSAKSDWVKKELNTALISEIAKRKVKILPVLLSKTELPSIISDKKYADFTKSYKEALQELLAAIQDTKDAP